MKKLFLLLFVLLTFLPAFAQQKEKLKLEDIYYSSKLFGKTVQNIQWKPDGSAFTFTEFNLDSKVQDIYLYNVSNGEKSLLVSGTDLKYNNNQIMMSNYQWTDDGKFLLIEGPVKSIWRHSTQAPFYLYNVSDKEINALSNGNIHLRNVKLSPGGNKVGFVRDHNIYIVDLKTGKETAVTTDGNENILNGEFDWVYEEEFGLADAWRWSPDGNKIAYWRLDQAREKIYHLIDEMGEYNKVFDLKYPKVGEQNAIVKIGVADLSSGKTKWMNIGTNDDIYIPRIFWTNSSDLLSIMRLNREQNSLELLMANANNGKSKTVITDSNNTWVDVRHDIVFLKKSNQIVWTSEISGFNHAYLYDYSGKLVGQITTGNWEVSAVDGVDENTGWVYFSGKKDSPIQENLYRVKIDGSNFQKISGKHGWYFANYAPDYKHFIEYYSNVSTPTETSLRNADGSLVNVLEDGKIPVLKSYNMVYPEFLEFKTTDRTELNAYIMKPADFDPSKKYPVLVYGYGGPGSQMVVDRWGGTRTFWHQYMTEQGYIVFCVDNRGTGGRGKAFKDISYGDLGKWSVHDQVEGAKYLATLPYVDSSRLGFWGWSGGGYLTCMMMTKGADYFKTGVAVAPVTDFRLYDAIWTERYMGLKDENKNGYDSANVLTYADKLKGKLMIVHGTGDDNVHYQNTMQFMQKLIDANKQFDIMFYPNKNHRISGGVTQLHLFTKITNYFLNNL
ncbi:MAG TPA: S9 family peptidase [Ignavibacteriaceae bacterium]|nr:S9 family peptidase [Ignavibacteriaceae bacterium]